MKAVPLDTMALCDPYNDHSCRCTGRQWSIAVQRLMARAESPPVGIVAHPVRRSFAVALAATHGLWLYLTPICPKPAVFLLSHRELPAHLDHLDPNWRAA